MMRELGIWRRVADAVASAAKAREIGLMGILGGWGFGGRRFGPVLGLC
jgi:hypothetical protein